MVVKNEGSWGVSPASSVLEPREASKHPVVHSYDEELVSPNVSGTEFKILWHLMPEVVKKIPGKFIL